tara:strand:- start:1807 stop:3012 length:1206 start_codon:yes stop_codon:yes gene_type:complete
MNKAFFINGGAGRVLCSMPALEKFAETNDDFIIVAESWGELYLLNKKLRNHVYQHVHKDLFRDKLIDKQIISPEPYRVNQYFTQKCNLIQAFDIEINQLDDIRDTAKINLELSKLEQITGYNVVAEVRSVLKKDKVVVFQPFGQSAKKEGQFIFDTSGRSFEVSNVFQVIEELKKNYAVIVMSEIEIPGWQNLGIACPQGLSLNDWAGVINAADYFVGCDSVGQHFANAVGKPATVVIGATFPENISYPNNKKFTIIDNGEGKRTYSPIRMTMDIFGDRDNEDLMVLESDTVKKIIKSVKDKIGVNKKVKNEPVELSGEPSKTSKGFSTCNTDVVGSYPKKTLLPSKSTSFNPIGMMEPSLKKDSGPVKYTGFKKTKASDSKKKPIDAILFEESKSKSLNS